MPDVGPLLALGLLLISGLLAGLAAQRLGLPRVAAYVLAGIAFSPDLLGRVLDLDTAAWSAPMTNAALGVIAYLIGGSLAVPQVRRIGRVILGAALGESLGAALAVGGAVWLAAPDGGGVGRASLALGFGAMAATTDPAGTVAVLHQYRVRGPVSTALLGVVAMDDAIGVVLYSLVMVAIASGASWSAPAAATVEIAGGLLLGGLAGLALARFGERVQRGVLRLPLLLGAILLVSGAAAALSLSPLLSAMSLGFSTRFACAAADRLFVPIEYLEEAVFVIFFTLAGASFRFGVFLHHLDLLALYFFARIGGKISGAWVGAGVLGAPAPVRRWLGLGLVPQAGVAIGLALSLAEEPVFRQAAAALVTVFVGATLLCEIIGPFATRFAVERAGELGPHRERAKP